MDGQSVKTTERGGIRGFDAHKRVKGRKRHILMDTFGLLIACRVEPADISDRRAAALLLGGLGALFPNIRTVIADAGHQSRKLARHLLEQDGWKLQIVKRFNEEDLTNRVQLQLNRGEHRHSLLMFPHSSIVT